MHLGVPLSVFLALQGGKKLKVFLGYTVSWMEASPGYMRLRLKNNHPNKQKNPICTQNSLLHVSQCCGSKDRPLP